MENFYCSRHSGFGQTLYTLNLVWIWHFTLWVWSDTVRYIWSETAYALDLVWHFTFWIWSDTIHSGLGPTSRTVDSANAVHSGSTFDTVQSGFDPTLYTLDLVWIDALSTLSDTVYALSLLWLCVCHWTWFDITLFTSTWIKVLIFSITGFGLTLNNTG